jgi:hypothetical protein
MPLELSGPVVDYTFAGTTLITDSASFLFLLQ